MKKKLWMIALALSATVALRGCSNSDESRQKEIAEFTASHQYGEYPQWKVSEKYLIEALNHATTTDEQGYVVYEGAKYAKVVAGETLYYDRHFSDYSECVTGETYWFRVTPIHWKILWLENKRAFVTSEYILDCQVFSNEDYDKTQPRAITNYKNSFVRSWLNGQFLNTAFHNENSLIETTNVDNSAASVGDREYPYVCENTEDKVFLLSYADITNADYGLDTARDRMCQPTDYAIAAGVSINGGVWWTRSPSSIRASYYVEYNGEIRDTWVDYVRPSGCGIRPAMTLNLV